LAADRELNNSKITLAWYFLGRNLTRAGYLLAAAESYERFDTALWRTHREQRNSSEVSALLNPYAFGMVPERLRLLARLDLPGERVRVTEWARESWPDDPIVNGWHAEALLADEDAAGAFAFCRAHLDDTRGAVGLLPIAVEAARRSGQLEDWVDRLVSDVAQGQAFKRVRELCRHLNRAEESAHALRLGQACLAQSPGDEVVAWEVAIAQQTLGDLPAALETLIGFIRSKSDVPLVALPRLATWMGWFAGDVDVAELVEQRRAGSETDFASDFVLAVSALIGGHAELGDELLRSCRAARPDFTPAYVVRGELLLRKYQWEAAKEHAGEILREHPDLAAAHYLFAEACDGLDENEQAERAYKQAIRSSPGEAVYRLALARHYRRLDNLRGAQRYYQEALEHHPADGKALEELIDSYLRDGKVEIVRTQLDRLEWGTVPADSLRRIHTTICFLTAPFGSEHLAELERQFERAPDDLDTARFLAGGLFVRGRLDEVVEVVRKVRPAQPEAFHFVMLQANVHALREEFDQAIELMQTLAERFPNRPMILEPLALYCFSDFRFELGRPTLERLLEAGVPAQRRGQYRKKLIESYVIFGEYDDALRLVERWIEGEPADDSLLREKADVLIEADRGDEALAALEEWLDRKPADPERRSGFYRRAPDTRMYEPIIERIGKWRDADPRDARVTEWLINVLAEAGREDEALEIAQQFQGTYAESFERRLWLGYCRIAKGETDKALEEFDALLSVRGADQEVRLRARGGIVAALVEAERYDQAVQRCDQWLEEPDDRSAVSVPLTLEHKRRVLQAAGRERECAEVMAVILEQHLMTLAPLFDDEEGSYSMGLLNDLGYTWVDLGINLERGTELIRRAIAAQPWNAAFIDSVGWAYYKAGDFANARKHLARAVRLRDGQDAVVYDHLGDAAYRLGDRDAARQCWSEALRRLETESSEAIRELFADVLAAAREKLAALERSELPSVAPTASEQEQE
jgi:tetratricopeptide (TPR) repeat protein